MKQVFIVIQWDEAALEIFNEKEQAERHLQSKQLTPVGEGIWAEMPEDVDYGKYCTLFEKKCLE